MWDKAEKEALTPVFLRFDLMIGVAFHSPSLVSLMIDRERFVTAVVPSHIDMGVQEELEALFAKKPPARVRRLLLVDKTETLGKIAALFPETKCRLVVFDVVEKLREAEVDPIIDVQEVENVKKLVSVKPSALNPALVRLKPSALGDLRQDFKTEEAPLAPREGRLVVILRDSKPLLQKNAVKYLLGMSSFATLKRSGRQDKPTVLKVQQYAESDYCTALLHAYMDMTFYNTGDKEAAVFSGADLEDLRFCVSVIPPDPDFSFDYEVPDKLKLARE